MDSNKETVGSQSLKLSQKEPPKHTAIDQMREQLTDYDKNLEECVRENKNKYEDDFYVVVLIKKERLMQNVLRAYFFTRHSCPTPDYNQVVYKYYKLDGRIEFLWVIPDAWVVNIMYNNPLTVLDDQKDLLRFVIMFKDKTLLNMAKRLNKEI